MVHKDIRKKTAMGEHERDTRHKVNYDNIKILRKEEHTMTRKIKEAKLSMALVKIEVIKGENSSHIGTQKKTSIT